MDFKVTPFGFDKLKKRMDSLGASMVQAVAPAIYQTYESVMTEAKTRTPVDTGALRSSGHVEQPQISSSSVKVRGAFGGTAAPYAVSVHEDPNKYHPVGEYKFLEKPLMERKQEFKDAINKAIKGAFKK